METSGLTEMYSYQNKNADLQDCMDILHLMQWDGICRVLLNYCTCFHSTIWMSGTLFVMILQTCICTAT